MDKYLQSKTFLWTGVGLMLVFVSYCYYGQSGLGMPCYVAVDENSVTNMAEKLFIKDSWEMSSFLAGSVSTYLSKIGLMTFSCFGFEITGSHHYFSRLFLSLLQVLSFGFVFYAIFIFFDRNYVVTLLCCALSVFSLYPYLYLFYVYPDKVAFILSNVLLCILAYIYKSQNLNSHR